MLLHRAIGFFRALRVYATTNCLLGALIWVFDSRDRAFLSFALWSLVTVAVSSGLIPLLAKIAKRKAHSS
jgi:hypothetical protein